LFLKKLGVKDFFALTRIKFFIFLLLSRCFSEKIPTIQLSHKITRFIALTATERQYIFFHNLYILLGNYFMPIPINRQEKKQVLPSDLNSGLE